MDDPDLQTGHLVAQYYRPAKHARLLHEERQQFQSIYVNPSNLEENNDAESQIYAIQLLLDSIRLQQATPLDGFCQLVFMEACTNELVGTFSFHAYSGAHNDALLLCEFYVMHRHQRKGYGREILSNAIQWASRFQKVATLDMSDEEETESTTEKSPPSPSPPLPLSGVVSTIRLQNLPSLACHAACAETTILGRTLVQTVSDGTVPGFIFCSGKERNETTHGELQQFIDILKRDYAMYANTKDYPSNLNQLWDHLSMPLLGYDLEPLSNV